MGKSYTYTLVGGFIIDYLRAGVVISGRGIFFFYRISWNYPILGLCYTIDIIVFNIKVSWTIHLRLNNNFGGGLGYWISPYPNRRLELMGEQNSPWSQPTISCLDEQWITNSTRGLRSGKLKLQEQESLRSFRKAP